MLMPRMEHKLIVINLDGQMLTVGWRVETHEFSMDAIEDSDGSVNTHVDWGDDQGADKANHATWAGANRWLETLLQSSRR